MTKSRYKKKFREMGLTDKKRRKSGSSTENKWRRNSVIPKKTLYKKFTGSDRNLTGRIADYIGEKCNNSGRKKRKKFNGKSFFQKGMQKNSFSKKFKKFNYSRNNTTMLENFHKKITSNKFFKNTKEDLALKVESQKKTIKKLKKELGESEEKLQELTSQKYTMLSQISELQEVKRFQEKNFQEKSLDERKIKFFVEKLKENTIAIDNLKEVNKTLKIQNKNFKKELEKAYNEILEMRVKKEELEKQIEEWSGSGDSYRKELTEFRNLRNALNGLTKDKETRDIGVGVDFEKGNLKKIELLKEVIENQRKEIMKLGNSVEIMNDEKFAYVEKIENLETEIEEKKSQSFIKRKKGSQKKLHLDKIGDTEDDYKSLKKKYKKVKKELKQLKKEENPTSVTKLALWQKERELENAQKAFRELQIKVFDLLEENERVSKQLEYFSCNFTQSNKSELHSLI